MAALLKKQMTQALAVVTLMVSCGKKNADDIEGSPEAEHPAENENPGDSQEKSAPTTETAPTIDQSLEVRNFSPGSQSYSPGARRFEYNFRQKILLADDGKALTLPACQYPLPAPGHGDGGSVKVDGNLADWPDHSVIAVDRAGDGPDQREAYDLRYIYRAQSSSSWYLAAETVADWESAPDPAGYLYINIYKIVMPTDSNSSPQVSLHKGFAVISGELYLLDGEEYRPARKGNDPGNTDFDISVKGNIMELRIAKGNFSDGLDTFAVDIFTTLSNGRTDRAGPFLSGYEDDYACMIAVPDPLNPAVSTGEKLLIMQRTTGVPKEVAELTYRALAVSVAEAPLTVRDSLTEWDTLPVVSTGPMNVAGVYLPAAGVFIQQNPRLMLHSAGLPVAHLFVAAHEMLHSYNLSDYALPTNWLREGHSNWFAQEVLKNFSGNGAYQKLLHFEIDSFLDEETRLSPSNPATLGDSYWGKSPFSQLFYYRKAALYLGLLIKQVNYEDLLSGIFERGRTQNPITGEDEFFDLFTSLSSYTGNSAASIKSGWFGGDYTDETLNKDLFSDPDHDGFLNFQEMEASTSQNLADSDSDGLSDAFEWVTGTDPLSPTEYSYLAVDNQPGDWTRLLPDQITESPGLHNPESPCRSTYNIARHGLVREEGQYLLMAELAEIPSDSDKNHLRLVLIIETAGGQYQLAIPFGSLIYSFAKSDGSGLRNETLFAPFTGTTVEIPFSGQWLGWSGPPPEGTRIALTTFAGETLCDLSDRLGVFPLSKF